MKQLGIAIVGAGPAGLAAALYLKRMGHRVTLIERFEAPAPVGSGLILQPTGLTILDDLGLFDEVALLGHRIDRLYGSDALTGKTVLDVKYAAIKGGRFGIAVHRAALFNVLFDAVIRDGITMETGLQPQSIESSGDQAYLRTESSQRLGPFDLIVDASGARSILRRYAIQSCEPKPLAYGAFWASLRAPQEHSDTALIQRYRHATTMIGVLPIGKPDASKVAMSAFFWSTKPDQVEVLKKAGIQSWKDKVHALWPECAHYLQQIDSFEDMTLARYGHHTLPYPIGEKLAIIGDAAHSTSPQLGQGANMALLDARALSYALATSTTVPAALTRYAAARRRHVRTFQALSAAFTPFYQSDSAVLPFIRDKVVAGLSHIPPAPQILAAMVSGTLVDPFKSIGLTEKIWK